MPIDELLRAGLPAAVDDVRPDVETDLDAVLRRAGRRSRVRRTAYVVGVVAAAVVVAVVLGLRADESRRSVDPAAPFYGVRVLQSTRGSADDPAPLRPGRYAIPVLGAANDALRGEVEVPTGWGQDRLQLATGPDADPHLRRIELFRVGRVSTDLCTGRMAPVHGGVTPIVRALIRQGRVRPSEPEPVSIDGYAGQLVRFRVPVGLDVERCGQGGSLQPLGVYPASWTSVFPGWTYRLWVLDLDGDPVTVLAAHGPETSRTERAELTDMVEGLRFTDPR